VRVGIDVGGVLRPDTGSGRYTDELIRALARMAPELELVLFCNACRISNVAAVLGLPGLVVNPRIPTRVLLAAWERLHWPPIEMFIGPIDVFHTSDWVHPPQRRGVTITTINDVGPLAHPEWYAPDIVELHRRKNHAAAALATAITTISEFTRCEFLHTHDVDPRRVHVVYPGVSTSFRPQNPDRAAATARRLGLARPFLLYVGTREYRKNVVGLIDIFSEVRKRQPDVMLAIVGMRPWLEAAYVHGVERWAGREVEHRIQQVGADGHVRVVGFVPLPELLDLYSAAEAFVYPTLYEGFGLPALEAMACGLPVVASSRSAVPEVVGDAGLLVDPDDPHGFAAATLRVLENGEIRERCRAKGIERASRFTWDATACETLKVYANALV